MIYRRIRVAAYVLCGAGCGIAIWYVLFLSPLFLITHLTVSPENGAWFNAAQHILEKKRIVGGMVPGNNMLFFRESDFEELRMGHPELKDITMSKDFFHHTLHITLTMRSPAGVWCGDGRCAVFDGDGVLYRSLMDGEASSSVGIVVEDSDQFVSLLTSSSSSSEVRKQILDTVITTQDITLFKDLGALFTELGMGTSTVVRENASARDVVFKFPGSYIVIINKEESFEEVRVTLLAAKGRLDLVHAHFIDLRIPQRIYIQ